jgi:hypothetical protein
MNTDLITKWADWIMDAWVADRPIKYAGLIFDAYLKLDHQEIAAVIRTVNEQQASYLEEAKENPYKPL